MSTFTVKSPHTFHIPVMGTGFMIDAPLRVARYGISSVISLVDDVLIEQMRKFHCRQSGEPYEEIAAGEEDSRARRITAYLNLLDRLVARQVEALRASPFEPGSEITRYFEMLPESAASQLYRRMLAAGPQERERLQAQLRPLAVPGSIDVNIMVKGDRQFAGNGEPLPSKFSDALAAFRGYANSTLRSAIVFSAGMNPRLYSYIPEFADFLPDEDGCLKKTIVLKVSDYRSAEIQGKFLAKRGLWVSEYRIESGLNCGGHAFPTKGLLMGPILEEFQKRKAALVDELHEIYVKALAANGRGGQDPYPVRVTVQGGIGTAAEDRFLREYYGADGTGWATPFLLVPEVTNVDDEHLQKLLTATEDDVYLSDSSPFGVPFWNLRTSASEDARRRRIAAGRPGSPCSKGFVKLYNTEFTDHPICTASREYQKLKLESLEHENLTQQQREHLRESVLAKSCICHDLAGGVLRKTGLDGKAAPAVCCGPGILDYSKIATLEEMVGHIYGRVSLVNNPHRPHMLLRELDLYISYLRDELARFRIGMSPQPGKYFQEFKDNLAAGIAHYRQVAARLAEPQRATFLSRLGELEKSLAAVEIGEIC